MLNFSKRKDYKVFSYLTEADFNALECFIKKKKISKSKAIRLALLEFIKKQSHENN